MEVHYCYRCRSPVPLFDDAEFAEFEALFLACAGPLGEYLVQPNSLPAASGVAAFFRPFLEEYERRTGFPESNPHAFLHHRRAAFGPPCRGCGRLLRTPRASRCVECGMARSADPGATSDCRGR